MYPERIFIVDDYRFGVTSAFSDKEHLHSLMLNVWTEDEWDDVTNSDEEVDWFYAEFTNDIDEYGRGLYKYLDYIYAVDISNLECMSAEYIS